MKYRFIILFLIIFQGCNFKNQECDLVVHNATIYTVDEAFNTFQAMAVKDGKILELGPEREILNRYNAKEYVDAQTRPVYPGFIDAHCHFLGYGLYQSTIDLSGTSSIVEILERLKDGGKKTQNGWIKGRGWDQNDWKNKNYPSKLALDSIFPDVPVYLVRVDGHAAWVNSAALKEAGLLDSLPENTEGIILEKGKPSGILIDNGLSFLEKVLPIPDTEEISAALLQAQEDCFLHGLTTVSDAGLNWSQIEVMDSLHQNGRLKMQIYGMLNPTEENLLHMQFGPYLTERLNIRSVKLYADGALGSRGAALKTPYSDSADYYGMFIHDQEFLKTWIDHCNKYGYQCNTHCIGDSSNALILNLYAKSLKGENDKRWRIEHAQVIDPGDMPMFRKYSVIPSVQPTHAISDMAWAESRLGKQRINHAYAYNSLLQELGLIALGTDFPVEEISPIQTFYSAVTRTNEKGLPEGGFLPKQKLSREDALRGMTIWAAIANFEESRKGSLQPGMQADFVILNRDIMKVKDAEILKTSVMATFIQGEKVYSR